VLICLRVIEHDPLPTPATFCYLIMGDNQLKQAITKEGTQPATPVGAHDGVIAASNALNDEKRTVDHTVIPRTIFTDPQVAVVG
jgi:hypothetical protein